MKRSEAGKYVDWNLPRDEIRKRLYELGFIDFYQEMEMDSTMVDAHQDISYTSANIGQHSHFFSEILYCVRGEVEYILDAKKYLVQPGDVVMIPPGVIHCPIFQEKMGVPYERYVLWISPAFFEALQEADSDIEPLVKPTVLSAMDSKWEYREYIGRCFARVVMEAENQEKGWGTCLNGLAAQLLVYLARTQGTLKEMRLSAKEDLLEKVLDHIQKNLNGRISVKETADFFHISESSLTHLFHKELGIGFYRCVMQRRLAEAKNLIGCGHTMEEVSYAVGFSEYSSFYRAFKAEYGVSPTQYRKMLQEKMTK